MLKKIPKFGWALLADSVIWLVLISLHAHHAKWCPKTGYFSCYAVSEDRLANLLALVAVVATILIPVAIVLWGDQFKSNALKKSSSLAKAWEGERTLIYVTEIVGGLAVLLLISLVLPLYIKSSALFWCAVLYGLWVLAYAFWVAFYKDPVDVYRLKPLNKDKEPIDVDIGRELITFTIGQQPADKTTDSDTSNQLWMNQLSDERTFNAIKKTIITTLNSEDKQLRFQWWAIWRRFLISCDIDSLISELNSDGVLSEILGSSAAYKKDNLEFTSTSFSHIASRLAKDKANADFIPEMYKLVKSTYTTSLDPGDLYNLFMPSFRAIFNATSTLNDDAVQYFPDKWKVTLGNLNRGQGKMPKTTASIYRSWIMDLQKYSNKPNEDAAITTTENIFPKSSTWIISMFTKFWINYAYFDTQHPELIGNLDLNLSRWKLYGHVGRVNTEWTDVATGEVTLAGRNALASDNETFDLLEKLGWINHDSANLFATRIQEALRLIKGEDEIPSWQYFSELMSQWAGQDTSQTQA
ncbi:MAG TPA: hypothetical protein VL989_03075 [Candidatus Sulfotelmatobacter sp.]|nr:hypothetical protein [Candidatus Sulfotelmatobacter sp.]